MPQDAFCLYHYARELNATIAGAKVNKIIMPNASLVVLYLYTANANFKLLFDTSPEFCRAVLTDKQFEASKATFTFCQLLRKHLSGAQINAVSLENFDRVLKFDITSKTEFDSFKLVLYVEIFGKYSNIFLTRSGNILGVLKPYALDTASKRMFFANAPYLPPPAQDKISPFDLEALNTALTQQEITPNYILNNIKGFSPFSANCVSQYLLSCKSGTHFENFCTYFNMPQKPCVIVSGGAAQDFYVRVPLGAKVQEFETLNGAIDYYYTFKQNTAAFNTLKNSLIQAVKKRLIKAQKLYQTLLDSKSKAHDYEKYKHLGDLIIGNIYKITKGLKTLTVCNYYKENQPLVDIALDDTITPSQNAQRYYKKYTKQKSAFENTCKLLEPATSEKNYLNDLLLLINNSQTIKDLQSLAQEIDFIGTNNQATLTKKNIKVNFRTFEIDGFIIRVGRSNLENDLLVKSSALSDIWLHTKNYPGSHTVIECAKKQLPQKIIFAAAQIAAFYSSADKNLKVEVDYCHIKFVKKPKGAKPGFVTYSNHKCAVVTPCDFAANKLN